MNTFTLHRTIRPLIACILITVLAGCSAMPFGRPPGDVLGSCEGTMRLESDRRSNFRFDLIRYGGDTQLFLTMPGIYRYRPVEDMDFGDGDISIELSSPKRQIRGTLTGGSLKFTGNFEGITGSLSFDLDE